MRRPFLLLFILPLLISITAAQTAEQLLNNKFAGKLLILRNFYSAESLHYNQSGVLENHSDSGSWTLAHFQIQKVRLTKSDFELQGKRIALGWDQRADKVAFFALGPLKIDVKIPEALITEEKITALDKVIFVNLKQEPDQVTDYWRDLILGNVNATVQKDGKRHYQIKGMPQLAEQLKPHEALIPTTANGKTAYQTTTGVTRPKPIHLPDPEYTEIARASRYEGMTVLLMTVDEKGTVAQIEILKPCGFGLDEKAVEAVKKWTFQPANLKGQPVNVLVNVEVSFRLRK